MATTKYDKIRDQLLSALSKLCKDMVVLKEKDIDIISYKIENAVEEIQFTDQEERRHIQESLEKTGEYDDQYSSIR